MGSSREYNDILIDRRQEISNFLWISRGINPRVAYEQNDHKTPEFHKEQVLKSPKIHDLLTKVSQQQNLPIGVLEIKIKLILDEIGYKKNLKIIRFLGYVLVKICQKTLTGIYVNQHHLLQIKQQFGHCPVVFVPSHRSYADFILMSLMMFHHDIAIPAIAAGMDFHGMVGIGTMLRNTGAFFMRRSYNDDHLYWTTFKQYIHQIVTKGELPIEFFIEGTRSRSNKSLSPKYGLILMILKAFFLSEIPDIMFVPINISYDRILEEKLFAFELLGIPKPKESTSGFFKSLSITKERYGRIYFHFSEPISVKQFFGDRLDRSQHNLQPINQQEITEDEKKLVPELAYKIIKQQQQHCVITVFNVIATLLNNNLTNSDELLTITELKQQILWFKTILEELNVFIDLKQLQDDLIETFQVHQNIIQIDDDNQQINLLWNNIILDKLNSNKLKAHKLTEKTISFSVPFIMLQIYINPLLYYLVDVAILTIILKYYQQKTTKDELFHHYRFLRSLFSQDFITFNLWENTEFEEALQKSLHLNIIRSTDNVYELGDNERLQQILCTSLDCFIYSYYQTCSVLQIVPNVCEEKLILSRIQEEIEIQMDNRVIFIHPYSLNLDTINNCLNSLNLLGIVKKNRSKGTVVYEINTNKVIFIRDKLEQYIPPSQILQNRLEKLQIHLKNKL